MKYEVVLIEEDDDFVFSVHETATDQTIGYFLFVDEAEAYKKFLESGGGFHGRTPPFILTDIPGDVNDKFENFLVKE